MKMCSPAPPFETVPSGAKGRAPGHSFNGASGHNFNGGLDTLLHEGEKTFCVKTHKIRSLTRNLQKAVKFGA